MSPALQLEATELLDAAAPMPPPRAVVIDLDELLDLESLCSVCLTRPALFPAVVCGECRDRSWR